MQELDRIGTPNVVRRQFDSDPATQIRTDIQTNLTMSTCTDKYFESLGEKAKQELFSVFPTAYFEKTSCLDQG